MENLMTITQLVQLMNNEKHTEPDTHQVNPHQQIQQIRSAIIYYGVIVEVETQI